MTPSAVAVPLLALLVGGLAACSDEVKKTSQEVTSLVLQERLDEVLAADPSLINCGSEIADRVLTVWVVPPLTDAEGIQRDLVDRMDVPSHQVRVVALDGTCGPD